MHARADHGAEHNEGRGAAGAAEGDRGDQGV